MSVRPWAVGKHHRNEILFFENGPFGLVDDLIRDYTTCIDAAKRYMKIWSMHVLKAIN
jgi:hypothetical protein